MNLTININSCAAYLRIFVYTSCLKKTGLDTLVITQ